ncbi:uncharacterized protein [Onthophagus taurus]|uniref:uncharacterized protein n=1 Tax=Onthophagus taurus TaxID=166361 RepID=UPI0039BE903C
MVLTRRLVYKEEIVGKFKSVCKMKSFVVVIFMLCFAWSQADNEGCTLLNGYLKLKEQEAFVIGEACLRIICQGNDIFSIQNGCDDTRWRGAPSEVYVKEITQIAENVRNNNACSGVNVPTRSY